MWFLLALLALSMLVARRSSEKHVAGKMNTLALSWLQQAIALPFIIITLFFARFYWPSELPRSYWMTMALYTILISIDIYCYFKALSLADVSYIAPLMTMVAIGNIAGAYFVLGQVPSVFGAAGAVLIVSGAYLTYRSKRKDATNRRTNNVALGLVVLLVIVRSFNSNIEVSMLRTSNPTTFNFYSSALAVPILFLTSLIVLATNKTQSFKGYFKTLKGDVTKHQWLLLFIGLTYTVNMLATYQAKIIAPNAGYIGAIKSASVLPMMVVGKILYKEKIEKSQWTGLGVILIGLCMLALN
jgi:drug/metabolite transporter (DMT)-like permease